ncbi:hypothetical protein H6P81_021218 [Aristolochia fimbriata]|uniref:Senescence-associated protein n=1 Tax=Aristolochia fimbriata TaxID=158543 RepID=A0AAV7DV16_ARIFI|nr:hypothetical protein H6P81_021218 [Aristolochia fimbriata]
MGLNLSGSWQQGHSATTIPVSVFKSSAKDSNRRPVWNCASGGPVDSSARGRRLRPRALGGGRPLTWSRQASRRRRWRRSSLDSDLEAFSHNPTPRSVPYWWVNNPTLGEFCFTMIGRADIEGGKKQRRYERLGCHKPVIPVAPKGRSRSVPGPTRRDDLSPGGEQLRAVHRQPGGLGLGPRAQPSEPILFRSYGSILPTSLAYIVPSTRGCSPWRPDAVMSTTRRGRHFRSSGFSRAPRGYPDTAASRCSSSRWTLPPAEPFQDLHRRRSAQARARGFAATARRPPTHRGLAVARRRNFARRAPAILRETGGNQLLDGSISLFAPIPKSDERFARQYRCGPPPEFPLASPRSGIVHHLSGPDSPLGGSRQSASLRLTGLVARWTSHTCQTPWSVFQGGSNGEPWLAGAKARRCRENASVVAPPSSVTEAAYRGRDHPPGLGGPRDQRRSAPESAADRLSPSRITTGASPGPIRFPPDNFKHSLTLFSKSFSSFPRALGRNLPPYLGCIPKQPDFADSASRGATGSALRGCHPLLAPHSMGLAPGPS